MCRFFSEAINQWFIYSAMYERWTDESLRRGERGRIDIANWFIMICKWHQHNISSSTSSHTYTLGGGVGGSSSKHKQRAMMMNLRRRMIRVARQQTRYAARCFRIHGAITNQMHARRHNVITICRARLILPTSQWQSRPRPNVTLLSLPRLYIYVYVRGCIHGAESCYCVEMSYCNVYSPWDFSMCKSTGCFRILLGTQRAPVYFAKILNNACACWFSKLRCSTCYWRFYLY